jgi:hypothetical protein
MYLVGVKNLVVEVDTASIRGMLNHPDLQASATINRWIQGILMFQFKLEHIPGSKHKGPDALSRCRFLDNKNNPDLDPDGWVDDIALMARTFQTHPNIKQVTLARSIRPEDKELETILCYLITLKAPEFRDSRELRRFVLKSNKFFVAGAAMYWRHHDSPPPEGDL